MPKTILSYSVTTSDRTIIDPPGCGCTDCITNYSRPANTEEEIAAVAGGRIMKEILTMTVTTYEEY